MGGVRGLVARVTDTFTTRTHLIVVATSLEGRHIELLIDPVDARQLMDQLDEFLAMGLTSRLNHVGSSV